MKTCTDCGLDCTDDSIDGGGSVCLPCRIAAETGGWHQLPRDAGQTVGVTYAVGWESQTIYRRSVDHSDGSIEVEQAAVAGGQFEPQNGILPELGGEWRTIAGCYR